MANQENRTQGLTAKTATIIFLACFAAQFLVAAFLYAIGGDSLGPLAEVLFPIISGAVMVFMAFRLIPKEIKNTNPTGLAWTPGNWENLASGLSIGCIIGVGSYFWDRLITSHSSSHSSHRHFAESVAQMIFTPGAQQIFAIVLLVLFGPTVEEMMFRGILYGGYRKSFGPLSALLITTAMFVAMHFAYYIHAPYRIVPYIVGSLVLLWCRLHWKAIGPAIAAHGGFNIIVAVIPALIFTWRHGSYEEGVAAYRASNFKQAITNLTRAIESGENSSGVYIYRGNARFREGDLGGAILDYGKAIELDTNDSAAWYDRGLAKDRNADFEGAIDDYTKAITLDPGYTKAYEDRGMASLDEGKPEAAMADFNIAIELNPTNSIYYNNRGWAEFLNGDFGSSISDATRSIQLDANTGYAYGTRGWARYKMGDVSGAVEDCTMATRFFKRGSALFFHEQGLLDFIAGDYKRAIADWQNAIEQEPDFKKELLPWIEKAQENSMKTSNAPEFKLYQPTITPTAPPKIKP